MDTLISIIIPCYNYAHFLTETLESVLNQTYINWECIIVNDGSTDNTEDVALKFANQDKRFKYFKKINEGRSIARNYGLKEAKGDYIQFLDADDLMKPEKLEKQITLFKLDSTIDITYCNFSFFDSNTGSIILSDHFTKQILDPLNDFVFDYGITGFIIPLHSALFRRALFKNKETFPSNIEAREDWLFWIQLALDKCKFKFINEKLVLYRKHEHSTTHNQNLVDFFEIKTAFLIIEKLPNEIKNEFIDFYSHRFAQLKQIERDKITKIYNSRAFKIIKVINKLTFLRLKGH